MTELCTFNVFAKSGTWPILVFCVFVPIDGHFGQMLWDMNFKFVFPIIYITFAIQTKFDQNWPFYSQNITKIAISQNPILPKCLSSKSLLVHRIGILTKKNMVAISVFICSLDDSEPIWTGSYFSNLWHFF